MTFRNATETDRARDTRAKKERERQSERGSGLYLVWKKKERSQKLSAAVITLN